VRVLTALVAGVLGAAAAAAVAYWVLGERDLSSALLIGGVSAAAGLLGSVLAGLGARRRVAAAVEAGGPYEVAVRLTEGESDLVGRRWAQMSVTVDGRMLSVSRLALGLRPLRRRAVAVEVLDVQITERQTLKRSAWVVAPGLTIVELTVPGGTLELASVPPLVEQVVARLEAESQPRP
jgi:hypothetical protein